MWDTCTYHMAGAGRSPVRTSAHTQLLGSMNEIERPPVFGDLGQREVQCQVGKPLLEVHFNGAMTHKLPGQPPAS